jgi:hypothetical protein
MSLNRVPLKNPQPKARFQESGDNVSKHRDLVDTGEFQRAVDFGILQYVAACTREIRDGNSAMAVGFKIAGAMEVLNTIRMLSENIPQPQIVQSPTNLNHES